MATTERIKAAAQALENECCAASTLAKCLAECRTELDNPMGEPAWLSVFAKTVDQLDTAAQALIEAIHRSDA